MLTKKSKMFLAGVFGTITLASIATPTTIYFLNHKKDKSKEKELEKDNDEINVDTIFPKLEKNDYYDYIRLNDVNTYWDENVIGAIVTDVIKTLKSSEGEVKFDYRFHNNNQSIEINFEWKNGNKKPLYKTYIFSITK